jgi:pimeloyl-ACP methyl ester carboxylesterase
MASAKKRNQLSDLRGASRLAVDATRGLTDLVEAMHHTLVAGPKVLGQPPQGTTKGLARLVYKSVRGVTGLLGVSVDVVLGQLSRWVAEEAAGREREAVVAALNGVLGDYLEATQNPLAIQMRLKRAGKPLTLDKKALEAALPKASGKVLLLVHGSSMSDVQWARQGHDHGAALERDLGFTALHAHYNSGLHVSTNGKALARLLERLLAEWPAPVQEFTIVAHSMGGLVARSAIHAADGEGFRWPSSLRRLVFLGTPHHGAPLERGGNWVDVVLGASPYTLPFARLGKLRSAGVTDLRYGSILDEDWQKTDRFQRRRDARRPVPLPEGVECFAMAAALKKAPGLGQGVGDGLVPLDSALGRHPKAELSLAIPESRVWVAGGMGHMDLLWRPEVYQVLRGWLAPKKR